MNKSDKIDELMEGHKLTAKGLREHGVYDPAPVSSIAQDIRRALYAAYEAGRNSK